jgi:enoyl-CoA hydratase
VAKIEVEERGPVRLLTVNRPEVHNCFDGETADGMTAAVEAYASDDDARVLVVTGAGGNFCSGADLKAASEIIMRPDALRTGPMGFSRLDPGKPVLAAVEGSCFAGGMELAAWCDVRIAGSTAEFGCLSRRWGVAYVDGGSQRFARIMGMGNALYLLETGAKIDADRALAFGFAQEVVPAGTALDRALELADAIAAYPQASLRADRRAAIEGFGLPLADALELEARTSLPTLLDPELARGLRRYAEGDRPPPPS